MIIIRDKAFDPYTELTHFQDQIGRDGRFGATVSFVGTARDFNDERSVERITLEHYPGMTERQLQSLVETACTQWSVIDALIVHRVGDLTPGDPIVLVAVWAAHRAPAFDACRYLIESLKQRAPFWKKESDGEQERWVTRNTPG